MATTDSFLDKIKLIEFLEKQGIADTDSVSNEILKYIKDIIAKNKKNNQKISELYSSSRSQNEAGCDLNNYNLPSWLKAHYKDIRVLGENTLIIPDGRKVCFYPLCNFQQFCH